MCCMLHNIHVGLRLAEAALTASVESAVTVWPPLYECQSSANSAEPALAQRWRSWQTPRKHA